MHADSCYSSRLAQRGPIRLNVDAVALAMANGEHIIRIEKSRLPNLSQELAGRRGEGHPMLGFLLGCGAGLDPNAGFQVELIPSYSQNLAAPGAGQEQ
jgi:hypothetical protein